MTKDGDIKECFFCEKEFNETNVPSRDLPDYTTDEEGNDVPVIRYQFLCPHCGKWTE